MDPLLWRPDEGMLSGVLLSELRRNGVAGGDAAIIKRTPLVYATTAPMEVVTCRLDGGRELEIACKYGEAGRYSGHGHWGGVAYEAAVYQNFLKKSSAPAFYGEYADDANGKHWLFLEFFPDSLPVGRTPELMGPAASWIASFHAEYEHLPGSFLKVYDRTYYSGWVSRTMEFAGVQSDCPWLPALADNFQRAIPSLEAASPTIIHGEYYSHNILSHNGSVHPIDWESAALAAGEIDLACLIEKWSPEMSQICVDEYQRARWPAGGPADFDQRLKIARLFVQFRWLGEAPELTLSPDLRWRFEELRSVGKDLNFL